MSLLWLRQLPQYGDRTPTSVPPPSEGRSSPINTPVFPPSSFVLPSFVWVYIFFSSGQVLLSTLSWCSACASVSEGVFLMYPWREIYSRSTYSSAILFSLPMWFLSLGCPSWPSGKESACRCKRCKRRRFNPWVGNILWRIKWQPSSLFLPANPMDRGARWATVHGVTKSQARQSN